MEFRQFTVTLEDMSEYKVKASYGLSFDHDCFSCWVEIHSVKPVNEKANVELTKERLADIESALSYLIVDEAEDLSTYEASRFLC